MYGFCSKLFSFICTVINAITVSAGSFFQSKEDGHNSQVYRLVIGSNVRWPGRHCVFFG